MFESVNYPQRNFLIVSSTVMPSDYVCLYEPTEQEDGRVIIIGDVHGMYDSMQCVVLGPTI